jgi:hypothetical protein
MEAGDTTESGAPALFEKLPVFWQISERRPNFPPCKSKSTPHPGFVILDSPLLAYRAPEGTEDDLRGTDLDERFYDYLAGLPDDRQVIVVENIDPPAAIKAKPQVEMFSGNPHTGRYGFFPLV